MPNKDFILLNDIFFKRLFGNESNKTILSCLLSELTLKNHNYIYENIIYLNKELGKINKSDPNSMVDILVSVDNIILNIEAYTEYNELGRNKNINYICKIWLKYYNYKNEYKNNKEIIQINFIKGREYRVHYIQDKKEGKFIENIKIIEIGLDSDINKRYTNGENKNLKLWLKLMKVKANDTAEIKRIIEEMEYDKKTKENLKKEVKETMEDFGNILNTTWKDLYEFKIASAKFSGEQRGLAKGEKVGRAKGKKNTIFKHIKRMLKKNMSYSDISDITGVSVEKIKDYSCGLNLSK